jgi:hypothetical protein
MTGKPPRESLAAELLALRETVQADLAAAPYELKRLAIAKLEPMLKAAYLHMYEGRDYYTTHQIADAVICTRNRASQLIGDLYALGLVARDTRVVNGRRRAVWKAK